MHIFDALVGLGALLRLLSGLALQTDQFKQADLRDYETFSAACDHQTGNNRQRERDLELDGGAFAAPAENVYHAAYLLDVGLNHIHADAAPRNISDGFRRGEARQEDQVQRLPIAQLLGLFKP